ncbi:hypothetical protein L208DRAFT_1402358 [Tricholoma matsutake]|nr:hypothetical protein L208DRAFT_1402358 [Tricholoma matsutake 945]
MDAEPKESDLGSLADDINDKELEDWEAELDESVQDQRSPQKNSKMLPLSRLNQLLIISNFATLHLKGISQTQAICMLARHYQIFEVLPIEKHGGSGNSRSWLYDEQVKTQTQDWLTLQKTGDGISEHTARRWLIKLGWHRTVVQKGVFLPAIVRHKGPELKKIMPEIPKGQRRGEQPLQKKGRGRLIHVSDFVNKEDGRLVLLDEIIYPGMNGDPWWDTKQLMDQIKYAIKIFESAHPDCKALFLFNQSSAHASLPPNALKAFKMNKSDGRKQCKQHDTTIPQSNPDPHFQGQPQKMTTSSGQQKGLQAVLEECRFNVLCLKAKAKIVAWPSFSLSRKIL